MGWGPIHLESAVLVVAWPTLRRWQRTLLLTASVALLASHWWALVWTLRGQGLALLTLQSAGVPWETGLALPLAWLLALHGLPRIVARSHGDEPPPPRAGAPILACTAPPPTRARGRRS